MIMREPFISYLFGSSNHNFNTIHEIECEGKLWPTRKMWNEKRHTVRIDLDLSRNTNIRNEIIIYLHNRDCPIQIFS